MAYIVVIIIIYDIFLLTRLVRNIIISDINIS